MQTRDSIVSIVMESLRRGEGTEGRVWNRLAWRTKGDGKIGHFARRFVEDETMDKNLKVILLRA